MTQEKLYEAYYMRVFSFVMTLAGDRAQAEEITQETFFRAFSRQSEFRGESDEATWLCAIAKNLFLDEKRRQKRHDALPEEAQMPLSSSRSSSDSPSIASKQKLTLDGRRCSASPFRMLCGISASPLMS